MAHLKTEVLSAIYFVQKDILYLPRKDLGSAQLVLPWQGRGKEEVPSFQVQSFSGSLVFIREWKRHRKRMLPLGRLLEDIEVRV